MKIMLSKRASPAVLIGDSTFMVKIALALTCIGILLVAAMPTTTFAASKTNQVRISYVPPQEPELLELSNWIIERRPLERLQEFLSPFRLPSVLEITIRDMADEHSTPAQRAFNVLCIAYGANTKLYHEFVSNGILPKKRAMACEEDYELIQDGYEALVLPHIDQDLAKEIFKRDWLREQ